MIMLYLYNFSTIINNSLIFLMAARPQIRNALKRERQVSTKEKYLQAQQRYLSGQFTYDSHCLIQNLTQKGKREPHMEGVQLYKTLIQIAKILMLNELQILFLGATLQQLKWKVIDPCLNPYIEEFKGLKQNIKSDNYNKKMQLSLLLIGYVVKVYLNETEETTTYEFKLRELVQKDYDKMYQEWVEKMKKNFKFSPKNMNKLFRQMDIIKTKKDGQLDDVNYNSKVDQLFKNYIEPEIKNEYIMKEPKIVADNIEEFEQEEELAQVPFAGIARSSSIQSIRSIGRRDSQRSERQFGVKYSLFRQSSLQQP